MKLLIFLKNGITSVLRFDLGKSSLFLNGKEVDEASFPIRRFIDFETAGSKLGALHENETQNICFYNGLIDDVQFFEVALTNRDIRNLYEGKPLRGGYEVAPQPSQLQIASLKMIEIEESLEQSLLD